MSAAEKYLICDDAAHAALVDELIMEHLREVDGSKASSWSGVYEKSDGTVAVVWDPCLIPLLGDPAKQPELTIETATVDKTTAKSNWAEVQPAEADTAALQP